MIEKFTYMNHENEVIGIGYDGIFAQYNNLRDFTWDYSSNNNVMSNFTRGIVKKTIPLVIIAGTEEKGIQIKNRLFEIAEKDVLAEEPGKIILGDYYMQGYIIESKKTKYLDAKGYMQVSIVFATDLASWVKETTVMFRPAAKDSQTGSNLDYPYDYPFDYSSEIWNKPLNNTNFVDTAFRLIVYGPCVNPAIFINGHTYQVNCYVSDNEYLLIDSRTKKIQLYKYNGEVVNCYNKRNRASYVFEKIKSGVSIVTWNGNFGFDVVLLEERSEPKWTF